MKNILVLLPRLILSVVILLIATLFIILGLLYFKHAFTIAIYSEWLFITSIIYIVIGIIPIFSVITSSNDVSIKYGEHMIKGRMDSRDRAIDSNKAYGSIFPAVMVVTGILCMASSALVYLI